MTFNVICLFWDTVRANFSFEGWSKQNVTKFQIIENFLGRKLCPFFHSYDTGLDTVLFISILPSFQEEPLRETLGSKTNNIFNFSNLSSTGPIVVLKMLLVRDCQKD